MTRISLIILTSCLSSCIIPIGLPGPEPYDKEAIAALGNQRLEREEIRASLGSPDVVRGKGDVWIYGETEDITKLFMLGLYPIVLDFNNYFVVVVEFSNNIANHIELIELGEGNLGCTETGICVEWWAFNKGVNQLRTEYVRVVGKPADDALAKSFQPVKGMCSIYIYPDARFSVVRFDMGEGAGIELYDYLYLLIKPGSHEISGEIDFVDFAETIDCADETFSFYELAKKNHSNTNENRVFLKKISFDAGVKSISKRHLVLYD